MTFENTTVLATAWLNQPALGGRPAHTLLSGAATLSVRHRFGNWGFELRAHSTTVTDNPADTMLWLAQALWSPPARMLIWRGEDIVVPSLIAACDTASDTVAAAKLLRQLGAAFDREVTDVAERFGGAQATSFDAIAHLHFLPFVPMTRQDLEEAHRTGCHGAIRNHLAARVKATFKLWALAQHDAGDLLAATDAWLASDEAEVRV